MPKTFYHIAKMPKFRLIWSHCLGIRLENFGAIIFLFCNYDENGCNGDYGVSLREDSEVNRNIMIRINYYI